MNEIKFDLDLEKENAIFQLRQLIEFSKGIRMRANMVLDQMRAVSSEEEFNAQVATWPEAIGNGFTYQPRQPEED